MSKSLFIGGAEAVRVEKTGERYELLIADESGNFMREVAYSEFMEYFKKLAYVCITSWDRNLIEQYREVDDLFRL